MSFFFFFFNDTATTEIYTLSLHDALPILRNYIWDFDGTLFDTYPAMVDGAQQALKDFGINMDKKEI